MSKSGGHSHGSPAIPYNEQINYISPERRESAIHFNLHSTNFFVAFHSLIFALRTLKVSFQSSYGCLLLFHEWSSTEVPRLISQY